MDSSMWPLEHCPYNSSITNSEELVTYRNNKPVIFLIQIGLILSSCLRAAVSQDGPVSLRAEIRKVRECR